MRKNLHKSLDIVGLTDPGYTRSKNEDCIAWNTKIGLAILTDGMGGAKAGEVAGRIAAETVLKEVSQAMEENSEGLETAEPGSNFQRGSLILNSAIHKANGVIQQIADDQPECKGMGSTIVSTLFYDNRLSVGHVGDSRLYLLRDSRLEQITEDHTVIQEMINGGLYTREEAENAVNKNIVTRAVGVTDHLKVDLIENDALSGDIYLICSDGLTDLVSDDEIRETLLETNDLQLTADTLINLANGLGGTDNISVILIKIRKPFPAKSSMAQKVLKWFS